MHYDYKNPVTAGFVSDCWHWLYSSAMDYYTDKKGLLKIIILDDFLFAKISNKETQGWSPAPGGYWILLNRMASDLQKLVTKRHKAAALRLVEI